MELDRRTCDRARRARDPHFDGRFFICVKTTGIYCRPVCPARTSKSENVTYVATAAAAEGAGFRPCLRCRPEASPGSPAWRGTSSMVSRALRLIVAAPAAGSIRALAKAVVRGAVRFDGVDVATLSAALHSIPSIAPRTAEFIAMRALDDPDAFEPNDARLERRGESWPPWRGYAAMLLWLMG